MKFTLIPLNQLSGRKTTIYSVVVGEEEKTLFDYFIAENIENYKEIGLSGNGMTLNGLLTFGDEIED